MKTGKIG